MTDELKPQTAQAPGIGDEQIQLLERLCNASGVSGDEGEVRAIVLELVRPYARSVRVDALGNVLVTAGGEGENLPRVMLDAHMDEVGLMLTDDEGEGIFRFEAVGGLDSRQMVGKPVWVGRSRTPGVIGAKPIHLTTADERRNPISFDNLRVDVGPGNGGKVKVGDRAAFATPFSRLGPSLRAKALDDRLGVATLIELVRHAPDNVQILAAFTVQEEVGLRGAKVAAHALDPQAAIALDATPAHDLPAWDGSENTRYNTRLGAGPALYLVDGSTLSDPRLVSHLAASAERAGVPYQFRQPGGGGTNAGAIHKQLAGIPAVSVSVPIRYAHTAASLARLSDWEYTLALVYEALRSFTLDILSAER